MAVRSFLATIFCLSLLAACAGTEAADTAGATCDQFRATPAIEQSRAIEVGTDLVIVLCSNPSTGFSWGDPQISDTSVVRLIDRIFRAAGESSAPIAGAPGDEVLTIRAVASGTTTLSIGYGQPWAGGTQGEWTYDLTVTVRS